MTTFFLLNMICMLFTLLLHEQTKEFRYTLMHKSLGIEIIYETIFKYFAKF